MQEKQKKKLTTILKAAGSVVAVAAAAFLILVLVLTVTEFRPASKETLDVGGNASGTLHEGDDFSIVTWNIGYGALGANADFFMDGGKHVSTADRKQVQTNIQAISGELKTLEPDAAFLQEVDLDSKRSHGINEQDAIVGEWKDSTYSFATNYKVLYVPYPIPTIGKVDCGILTLSGYKMENAERISLPCPFSYPVRIANLKRCLMVDRIPVEDSDRELVLVNLHLEAYDDGEGKAAQTKMLKQVLQDEVDKGNYVIAGGDFNQSFSNVDISMYPQISEDLWHPGCVDVDEFGSDLNFVTDNRTPSCRSLDQPYEGADPDHFQYYLIDGFIVSSNLTVDSVETQDLGFANSDHNPVLMKVTLGE